jgi:hypothetical protein
MSTTKKGRVVGAITRLKQLWQELDYAQRRSLELRTGLSFDKPDADASSRAEIRELESLYDLPAHDASQASGEMPQANIR